MTDELAPPGKGVEKKDPGAHELTESSGDEHFSDASEGHIAVAEKARSNATSPVPITRVERVDDQPSHGEVPGTDAYNKRVQDAVPDEVEIIPDGGRSRSTSRVDAGDRPVTPGGSAVPKTVVERVDDAPAYGDVPGTHAYEVRAADAVPDVVVKAPQPPQRENQGSPTASINRSPLNSGNDASDTGASDFPASEPPAETVEVGEGGALEDDGGFGDDFDDFEEGGEGDDFGDFDDGFQQGEEQGETFSSEHAHDPTPVPTFSSGPPVLDIEQFTTVDDMWQATKPYIDELYPSLRDAQRTSANQEAVHSIFLSERSLSLWSQLIAPPPLQPPDWVRSRIRRAFLVSLGVPVDLDEILPASKQKKLVLPSIHIPGDKSPRPSADGRNGALGRVKKENVSTTSVDSSASKTERKRRGPPPPPELDISSTSMLCSTTNAALHNFTDDELRAHIRQLTTLKQRAAEVFDYWQKRMESALGDKDAFEQVIESLVAHAKKLR